MKKSFLFLLIIVFATSCKNEPKNVSTAEIVSDPYAEVDWAAYNQYKAGLHCHTSNSTNIDWPDEGTVHPPREMALQYKSKGYDILAITDHDFITYPWDEKYELADIDMLGIQGCELSKVDNICSYFNDFRDHPNEPGITVGFNQCIDSVGVHGGVAYLAHPARQSYTKKVANCVATLAKHPCLVGIEVLNCGQYANNNSLELWDGILSEMMPERNVWGTSSDDAHGPTAVGVGWSYLLCRERTVAEARRALEFGLSYFATKAEMKDFRFSTPKIASITVDTEAGTIEVIPVAGGEKDQVRVEWTSMGEVVFTGEKIDYRHTAGIDRYLRATVYGLGGRAFTQPWGIKRQDTSLQ